MRMPLITLTGVDDSTPIDAVVKLHTYCLNRYQAIEFGVLLSPTRQGVDARYPSMGYIERLSNVATRYGLSLSAHYCGGYARSICLDSRAAPTIVDLTHFHRVQINHTHPNVEEVDKFGYYYSVHPIIQTRSDTFPEMPVGINVSMLYDCSGGKGVKPSNWPPHPSNNILVGHVGYAGGITPDNVIETIESINCDGRYWIDMESGVRTDGKFDIEKCRAVCDKVFEMGR